MSVELGSLAFACLLAGAVFDVEGTLVPASKAMVGLHGATHPFAVSTLADSSGRFRFRRIEAGTYTLAVFFPTRGELRQTVEVGPGSAGPEGKVSLTIQVDESKLAREDAGKGSVTVSRRELAIANKAANEYRKAQELLAKHKVEEARTHLLKAVEIAPQYAEAWNNLGTIAYQTQKYEQAKEYFREALLQDPEAFAPLVNLGGVLVTLNELDDALKYNLYAVLRRPGDALANSQMGMAYFMVGKFEYAEKYLAEAVRIDPAHFSHPQMLLAEIHLRQGKRAKAIADFESFLAHHPDDSKAPRIREAIARLKAGTP